jgi:hypothetical protein
MSGERAPDMPPPPPRPDQQQEGDEAQAAAIAGQPVGVQLYGEGTVLPERKNSL